MKDGNFWIAAGALLLTALSLVLNFFIERYRAGKQLELKKYETEQNRKLKEYEVEFMDRRKTFGDLFGALRNLLLVAARHDSRTQTTLEEARIGLQELWTATDEKATACYNLMTFLPASDHDWFEDQAEFFERMAGRIWSETDADKGTSLIGEYEVMLKEFRAELFDKLFG